MTTITIATRVKENPTSRIGLSFGSQNGRLKITRVDENGLFGGSGLEVGQELLSINGITARGKSTRDVAAILASLDREVTIQAGPGEQTSLLHCTLKKKQLVRNSGRTEYTETLSFDWQQKNRVPGFLGSKGVSHQKWDRVVMDFTNVLMPAVQQSLDMDHVLDMEMEEYIGKQWQKGEYHESKHERKVFMMTHQAAIQHSNLTLVASNVVSKANALMNVHGVVAELCFTEKNLPTYTSKFTNHGRNKLSIPTAIKFTPIDANYGNSVGASAAAAGAVVSATAIACSALEENEQYVAPAAALSGESYC